jgi:hypothetical protein
MVCCWNDGHYPSSILDKKNTYTTFRRVESVSVIRTLLGPIELVPISETSCVFIKNRRWIMLKKFVISAGIIRADCICSFINIALKVFLDLRHEIFTFHLIKRRQHKNIFCSQMTEKYFSTRGYRFMSVCFITVALTLTYQLMSFTK